MQLIKTICCLFILLSCATTYAQKGEQLVPATQVHHYQKTKRSTYVATNIPVKALDVQSLKEIVSDFFADQKASGTSLVLMRQKESPAAHHYRFQQMYRGLPVYNASVDLVVSKKNVLKSISHSIEQHFPEVIGASNNIDEMARNFCASIGMTLDGSAQQIVFHTEATEADVAIMLNATDNQGIVQLFVLDLSGDLLFAQLLTRLHSENDILEAQGMVFSPDPLTSAEVSYGGGYADNNDMTSPELDAELKTVTLETCMDEGTGLYLLRNDVLAIVDFDNNHPSPNVNAPPPTSETGEFFFNRSEPGFEAVSAFYHITSMKRHLDELGFTTLCSDFETLEVDARATIGTSIDPDNSVYNSSRHEIRFGTGGIDDAEDADVCVHEYGHALSFCANENSASSMNRERDAIEEGLCDYFAASYSREISEFQSGRVFNWDGNFGNWSGRSVTAFSQYPMDLVDNQYGDAPIWSSVLMEIQEELGRDVTDQLLMQAMFAFTPNTGMPEAAAMIMDADGMLNDCENFDVLTRFFHKRGLIDFEADAGEDVQVCLGESTVIGGKLSNLFNSQIVWSPSLGLSDPEALFPEANPPRTTTYTITITDNLRDEVYVDGITVTVLPCFDENYSNEIEILNSIDLSRFGTGAFIRFPEELEVEGLRIYNASGGLVFQPTMNEDNLPLEIDLSKEPVGVYILEVRTAEESKVFKLLSGH